MAAPTIVAATAIIAAKRELCSPLSSSATANRSAHRYCSYCTKSDHFRDVMEKVVLSGAGLCRARVAPARRT